MADPREQHIYMHSTKDGANKDYNLHLVPDEGGTGLWRLTYENGPHLAALKAKPKIEGAVAYEVAKKEFDKVVAEKMKKSGYQEIGGDVQFQNVVPQERRSGIEPQLLETIPDAEALARMDDPAYTWEEKKDGQRRPIRKSTSESGVVTVIGTNRDGLIVPIPKDLEAAVAALPIASCTLDGEDMGYGRYAAFDLISCPEDPHGQRRYEVRRDAVRELLRAAPSSCWVAIQYADTPEGVKQLDADVRARGGEGLVGKRKDAPYSPGMNSKDQFKYPYLARVTCYVEGHDGTKRSVKIAVLDAKGEPVSLKKVTVPVNHQMPEVGTIVDIEYLYAYQSGGLAQPRYIGVREDRRREHCVATQLKFKQEDECVGLAEAESETEEAVEIDAPGM